MKDYDNIIRASLKKNGETLEDSSFTLKIVNAHLSRKIISANNPFLNFGTLVIGIVLVIISAGLILLLKVYNIVIDSFVFTEQCGLILLLLSLIFLGSTLIGNLTIKKRQV